MTQAHCLKTALFGAAGAAALAAGAAHAQEATLVDAIAGGKPILDLNLRTALIDQDGLAEDATAVTLRTRLGWQTGVWNGFSALAELEDVRAVVEDYNSTLNGKGAYPVEADPEGTELNRAFISWTNGEGATVTGGRQRIILDDARFVGNVGWRQDEQTFDSVRADFAIEKLSFTYAYLWGIERVFAEERDFDSDSHLINVTYAASPAFKATGFYYDLDLEEAPAASTTTIGGRVSGSGETGGFRWDYLASYATQDESGANPNPVDLDYWKLQAGAGSGPLTLTGAYEVLEGDGTVGFSTPLATLHAFQGWADVFLTTPASGIEDASVALRFAPDWTSEAVSGLTFMAVYHDFSAETGGGDLGSEIDLQVQARIAGRVGALAKFADYDGPAGGPADRTKIWFGLSFSL